MPGLIQENVELKTRCTDPNREKVEDKEVQASAHAFPTIIAYEAR